MDNALGYAAFVGGGIAVLISYAVRWSSAIKPVADVVFFGGLSPWWYRGWLLSTTGAAASYLYLFFGPFIAGKLDDDLFLTGLTVFVTGATMWSFCIEPIYTGWLNKELAALWTVASACVVMIIATANHPDVGTRLATAWLLVHHAGFDGTLWPVLSAQTRRASGTIDIVEPLLVACFAPVVGTLAWLILTGNDTLPAIVAVIATSSLRLVAVTQSQRHDRPWTILIDALAVVSIILGAVALEESDVAMVYAAACGAIVGNYVCLVDWTLYATSAGDNVVGAL